MPASHKKKICVIIPYFNSGRDLLVSLHSFEDDSLLPDIYVIDDGSEHFPAEGIIKKYKGPLDIQLIVLPRNRGIEYALNAGLSVCVPRYKYIARLDCGDINLKNRITDQYDFMERFTEYGMVGGWVNFIDTKCHLLFTLRHPVDSDSIRKRIFLNSPFTHPAIMVRSSVFKSIGYYPTNYPAAEDLALFFLIVKNYKTANLPRSIVSCVVNENGISSVKRKTQISSRIRLIIRYFNWSPMAFIGLLKGVLTYWVPRSWTVYLNRIRNHGLKL